MPKADHHAVLVAITTYPGLSALQGPEHDANAFAKWLVDPAGGDLPEDNIARLYSSAYPAATEHHGAQPTENQFKQALDRLVAIGPGEYKERVGERLYLFLAGHGFTAGTLANPALLTAEAHRRNPAHIAALVFAERIRRSGFFDEIVLVMDCCQDALASVPAPDTHWQPPDQQRTEPKLMYAVGAPRGRKSFEASEGDGPVRGYFSRAFLQALQTAATDADGWVTARHVEERLLQIWIANGFLKRFQYEPPISAPRDLKLYRRAPPVVEQPSSAALPAPPRPAFGPLGAASVRSDQASTRYLLQVRAHDSGAAIDIVSLAAGAEVLARGTGEVKISAPRGQLAARFRIGDERVQQLIDVPAQRVVEQPALQFSSPVPMPLTSTFRDSNARGAAVARTQLAKSADAQRAAVLVFAGGDDADAQEPWSLLPAASRVRLLRMGNDSVEAEGQPIRLRDAAAGWSALGWHGLDAAHHLLGFGFALSEGGELLWHELAIPTICGYRTEIYVAGIEDETGQRRPDLATAAVLIVPAGESAAPNAARDREVEVARLALLERRPGLSVIRLQRLVEDPLAPALLLLYTAYALTHASRPDGALIARLCERLDRAGFGRVGDVQVLSAFAAQLLGLPIEDSLPPGTMPCLARGWELAAQIGLRLSLGVQLNVATWRQADASWTQVQVRHAARRADPRESPLRAAVQRALARLPPDATVEARVAAIHEVSTAWLVNEDVAQAAATVQMQASVRE